MSTFNGSDIFRSSQNPSKVTIGGVQGRNILNRIPGIDGAFSQNMGWEPKQIMITGVIDNTSIANLKTSLATIQSFVDHLTYTLVDNFGNTFNYVKMDSFRYGDVPGGFNSQITQRGASDFITFYQCRLIQLNPGTAQP